MGLYTDTKIYPAAKELMVQVVRDLRSLPRDYQVSLGYDARRAARGIVMCIYRANSAWERAKVPYIQEILDLLEDLKLTLRICDELKLIAPGQHAALIHHMDSVGKQATGWRDHFAGAPVG